MSQPGSVQLVTMRSFAETCVACARVVALDGDLHRGVATVLLRLFVDRVLVLPVHQVIAGRKPVGRPEKPCRHAAGRRIAIEVGQRVVGHRAREHRIGQERDEHRITAALGDRAVTQAGERVRGLRNRRRIRTAHRDGTGMTRVDVLRLEGLVAVDVVTRLVGAREHR